MTQTLKDKIAIVTGGASGFGAHIAKSLAKEGTKVAIVDVDVQGGEKTAGAIIATGESANFYNVDVRSSRQVQKVANEIRQRYGKVDILINSAGVHQYQTGTVVETEEEEYDTVMDTNVKGIFLTSKYIIPLIPRSGGVIINLASAWGMVVSNRVPIYCTSKAAVIQLSKAMALDHAVDNIRVISICPGTCRTPMVEKIVEQNYLEFGYSSTEEMWNSRISAHPLGRVGSPEDIAGLVLFLVSGEASWITGAAITVDGGFTLGKTFSRGK